MVDKNSRRGLYNLARQLRTSASEIEFVYTSSNQGSFWTIVDNKYMAGSFEIEGYGSIWLAHIGIFVHTEDFSQAKSLFEKFATNAERAIMV